MLTTLGELKSSRLKEVAQASANSDEFVSLVNGATERLMRRGDWPGTVVPICAFVKNGCVTWPRHVGQVRRINRCGQEIRIGNLWYDYVDREVYSGWRNSWNWGNGGWTGQRNVFGGSQMTNQGRYPTYEDVCGDGRKLRAYALCQQDVNKKLTIFGLDSGGQTLRTQQPDGSWLDGIVITLAVPYAETTVLVSRIDRVLKDETQMNVPLYSYSAATGLLTDLANYEPSETNPNYERDRLITGVSQCCTFQIAALVKLKFVKAKVDTDLVLIDNVDALKFAIQAIKLEEGGQDSAAQSKLIKAVQELNLQLNDNFPIENTPVDSGFMGGGIGMQRMT